MKTFHIRPFSEGAYVYSLWACSGLPVSRLFARKKNQSIRRLFVSIKPRVSDTNLTIKYGSKLFKDSTCTETASKRFNGADFRNRTACVLLRKSVGMSESSKSNKRLASNGEANQTSIFEDGQTIPAGSGRLRKAGITARNGRVRLLSQQLLRVVKILLEDSPRIVFIPNLDRSTYVTVLFWVTNDDEGYCTRMRHIRSIQQEVSEDGIKLYFQVEAVYALPLFVNYMFDKCICYDVFNSAPTCLSELDGKQLDFVLEILNIRNFKHSIASIWC